VRGRRALVENRRQLASRPWPGGGDQAARRSMGRRDSARTHHLGSLTGFCCARPQVPITTRLEVTTDGRRATHGREGRALACFLNLGRNFAEREICVGRRSLMATVVSIGSGAILRSSNKHPIRHNGTTVRTKLRLRNGCPNTAMENFRPLR
jgi:hypothetical protein